MNGDPVYDSCEIRNYNRKTGIKSIIRENNRDRKDPITVSIDSGDRFRRYVERSSKP